MRSRALGVLAAVLLACCLAGCGQGQADSDEQSASQSEVQQPSDSEKSEAKPDADAQDVQSDEVAPVPESALVGVEELHGLMDAEGGVYVLDIRTRKQHAEYYIPSSHNIPMGKQMESRLSEIPIDEDIYIISSGDRGCAETYDALVEFGYDPVRLFVVEGGMNEWLQAGYPVEKSPILSC